MAVVAEVVVLRGVIGVLEVGKVVGVWRRIVWVVGGTTDLVGI